MCSTNHMQRRLDFFTLPVEKNIFGQSFLEWQQFQLHTFLARYNGHHSVRQLYPFHAINGNEIYARRASHGKSSTV